MPSIEEIIRGAADVQTSIGNAAAQTHENFKQQEKIAGNMAAIFDTVANDQAIIARAQKTAELTAQQASLRAANAAGVNPNAAVDAITELMGQLQVAHGEVRSGIQELRSQTEINPLEHPLDALVGAFKAELITKPKLEGAAKQADALSTQLGQVNQAVQQSAKTYSALQESVTTASVEASARVASAEAQLRAQQAAIDGLRYNTEGINAVANANKEILGILFNVKTAQNAEKQMQMSLESMKLDRERFEWQKQEKQAADEAKAEGKQIDQMVIEDINRSLAAVGMPQLSGLEAKSAIVAFKSGASKELSYHWENGRRIRASGVPMVGSTPAESAEVLSSMPNNLPAARLETAKLIKEAEIALAGNMKIDKKDKEAAKNYINEHVRQSVALQYADVKPNTGNIFDVGDLISYREMTAVRDLAITKKFIAPMIQAGQPLNDPRLVLQLGVKAVADGKITSSEFQDLAVIYQVASQVTQQSRGLTGFGIVPPNAGRNYFINRGGIGGKVDMTSPAELGRVLMMDLQERIMQNRIEEGAKGLMKTPKMAFGVTSYEAARRANFGTGK